MQLSAAAIHDPLRIREAGADLLSLALIDARNHTLAWLAANYVLALAATLLCAFAGKWPRFDAPRLR